MESVSSLLRMQWCGQARENTTLVVSVDGHGRELICGALVSGGQCGRLGWVPGNDGKNTKPQKHLHPASLFAPTPPNLHPPLPRHASPPSPPPNLHRITHETGRPSSLMYAQRAHVWPRSTFLHLQRVGFPDRPRELRECALTSECAPLWPTRNSQLSNAGVVPMPTPGVA